MDFNKYQPNSHYELTLNNAMPSGNIPLPASLNNSAINVEFFDNFGNAVVGATSGTLQVQGRYNSGKWQTINSLDLSNTDYLPITGKFTELKCALSGLTGASTIVVNCDQNINMV